MSSTSTSSVEYWVKIVYSYENIDRGESEKYKSFPSCGKAIDFIDDMVNRRIDLGKGWGLVNVLVPKDFWNGKFGYEIEIDEEVPHDFEHMPYTFVGTILLSCYVYIPKFPSCDKYLKEE